MAVVGSRAATAYGQDVAHEIADGVAERGFTVVSGGALGIDGFAHAAALRAGGRTVAVLAGGIDRPYPRAHESLIGEIAEVGAVRERGPPGLGADPRPVHPAQPDDRDDDARHRGGRGGACAAAP